MRNSLLRLAFVLALTGSGLASADTIRVAVASNFVDPLRPIAQHFEAGTGHTVILSPGSTGKLFAQIVNGAPFDAFLAADTERPARLERDGLAVPGSRFTYAVGRLMLWSPRPGYVDDQGTVLETGRFRYLAIANPELAPYGRAAREVLESRGLWNALQGRLVRGENIGQAFQFVNSGNAELGFLAYAQIRRPGHTVAGSGWLVPQSLHAPIAQQAVLLKHHDAARAFLLFLRSETATEILRGFGYGKP